MDGWMGGRGKSGSFRVVTSPLSDASTTTTWTRWVVERRRSVQGKMLRRLGNGVSWAALCVGRWAGVTEDAQ
jgi:surface antigen